ncbi:MAG: 50S ribosomal protein L15 [Deltaproteobacteria bacterium]|nr:MAG: 50S ribosomal protein L15 [Deltaproteobacteria bacterium]HEX15605.1 50S ribosomal protein L15 [Deltaproteobacteria bacterium]
MLDRLSPPPGAVHRPKRVGRGPGSGHGKTSCRGTKGQKARSSPDIPRGFEGGQMPLHRRLPKRGFRNPFRKEYAIVNVRDLNRFPAGSVVDVEALEEAGLVKGSYDGVKILGDGNLEVALTVKAHKFSRTAVQKIEAAGGTVEILP